MAARPEHPAEFAVRPAQVLDQAQDVAAPDQVDGGAGGRQILDRPGLEGHGAARPGRQARGLDAPGHRIDAGDLEAETPGQLERVLALPASRVQGGRAGRKPHGGDVFVEHPGARGVEGLIQRLVELLLDEVERVMDICWDGHELHPPRGGGPATSD
jgi:hypothetical protein